MPSLTVYTAFPAQTGSPFDGETFDIGAIYTQAFQDYDNGVVSNYKSVQNGGYSYNYIDTTVTYDQTLAASDGTSTVIHVTHETDTYTYEIRYGVYQYTIDTITIGSVDQYYGDQLLYTLTDAIDEKNRSSPAYTTSGFYGAGNQITVGGGNSTILGGGGDDIISVGFGTTYVAGQAGNDTLIGGNGSDHLEGDDGDDILTGGGGNDYLDGGNGNDTLFGGPGADVLVGGAGSDTASYAYSQTPLVVSLTDPTQNTGEAAGDSYNSIENLTGSYYNDTLIGDAGNNTIQGLGGDDILIGADGDDTLDGGYGNNQLYGGTGNDTLVVYSGNNLLFGNDGNDTLTTLGGFNILDGGAGADMLRGGAGFDWASYADAPTGVTVNASALGQNTGDAAGDTFAGIEGIMGTSFADTLIASATVQTLAGYAGDDVLVGVGQSTLYGGLGNDTYYVTGATDQVVEGAGEGLDTVFATGSYVLPANVENLFLQGNAVNGIGNGGDNVIVGNALNNVLSGGAGNDTLIGGAGNDTFVFRAGYGHDAIADFQGAPTAGAGDAIQLHPALANSFASVLSHAADVSGNTVITFDAATSLTLTGVTKAQLTPSNFVFA